jgi:hypothetical protein
MVAIFEWKEVSPLILRGYIGEHSIECCLNDCSPSAYTQEYVASPNPPNIHGGTQADCSWRTQLAKTHQVGHCIFYLTNKDYPRQAQGNTE